MQLTSNLGNTMHALMSCQPTLTSKNYNMVGLYTVNVLPPTTLHAIYETLFNKLYI